MSSSPPILPRELVDSIITTYIQSYDDDPTYQWTVLRHITRYYRNKLEAHFRTFWLPKLKFTIYLSGCSRVSIDYTFSCLTGNHDVVIFRVGDDAPILRDFCHPFSIEDKIPIARLGEGILNHGYAGGGVLSDARLAGFRENAVGDVIEFDWKGFFTNMFCEEALMRTATRKLIDLYTTAQQQERQTRPSAAKAATERVKLVHFLRVHVQFRRRNIVHDRRLRYLPREQDQDPNPTLHRDRFYDLGFEDSCPGFDYGPRGAIFQNALEETSVLFSIPGWREWGIREFARLRGEELRRCVREYDTRWWLVEVDEYSPQKMRAWLGGEGENGEKQEREEVLERELKDLEYDEEMVDGINRWRDTDQVEWISSGRDVDEDEEDDELRRKKIIQAEKLYKNFEAHWRG